MKIFKSACLDDQDHEMAIAIFLSGNQQGHLYMGFYANLMVLPDGLEIGGNAYLQGCSNLIHLPEGLRVMGSLIMSNCVSFINLPDDFEVHGMVDLRNCPSLSTISKVRAKLMFAERLIEDW